MLTVSSNILVIQNFKNKNLCQDLTEPDQGEKDPEPAGRWVNAVMVKTMLPERNLLWAEVWAEVSAELQYVESEEVPEEARAEMPGRIRDPNTYK